MQAHVLTGLTPMIETINSITNTWTPERYHGHFRQSDFFEGWYYKFENADRAAVFALIVGVSKGEKDNHKAFVQFVNGAGLNAVYADFYMKDFHASRNEFLVRLQQSEFSKNMISLRLPNLEVDLQFSNHKVWHKSIMSPNITGPLSYWPNLGCNHREIRLTEM